MSSDHKLLHFPSPPAPEPDVCTKLDITAITEDILNAARLAALDVAAERLIRPQPPASDDPWDR